MRVVGQSSARYFQCPAGEAPPAPAPASPPAEAPAADDAGPLATGPRLGDALALGRLALGLLLLLPLILLARIDAAVARWWWRRPRAVRAALRRLQPAGPERLELAEVRALPGGHANLVLRLTLRDAAGRERRAVLKRRLFYGSLLSFGGRWLGPMPRVGSVRAAERARREVAALRHLRRRGHLVPACLSQGAGLILMEWLDGVPVAQALARPRGQEVAGHLGRALAALHGDGAALCDAHPGNALLLRDGRVALLDLEFAVLDAAPPALVAFDVAYCAALLPDEGARRAFLRGYAGAAALPPPLARACQAEGRRIGRFAPLLWLERRHWRRLPSAAASRGDGP